MKLPELPEHVARINPGDPFSFSCHKDVDCFTHCCRQLELSLTPYDVLRLRRATGLNASELLDKYIIVEQEDTDIFPRFYLTMVNDGNDSCVFVTTEGCSIYTDRPGACRSYPMGRGVVRQQAGIEEVFVLLHEPHCLGFLEKPIQTIERYTRFQGLELYNRFNDMLTEIQQHPFIRNGMRLSPLQVDTYTLALYNLDEFREQITKHPEMIKGERALETIDDETLLTHAFQWLKQVLFDQG